ncbi:MAG: 2-amino-4-hydroxy-6-hydroxymethyldihydropteridine diphosphokinase [Phycisphaerales bacterium]
MNTSKNNPCNRQKAAIALGSNLDSALGDRASHLAAARVAIGELPGTTLLAVSKDFETDPVVAEGADPAGQGKFLNAAVTVETSLAPMELLTRLLQIERTRGRDREREERWGPRTLDLDLILFGDRTIDEPGLQLPHPRMHERLFVLDPLAEVAGDWKVAGREATVGEVLAGLRPEQPEASMQIEGKPSVQMKNPQVSPGAQ